MADDEVEARFRELVSDEFGIDVAGPVRREKPPPRRPYRPRGTFSLSAALEAADPTPEAADRFVPPEPEPLHRPHRPLTYLAIALLASPLVVGTVRLAGVSTSGWVAAGAGIAFGLGLALFLFVLLPRRRPDPDDGGIRL